jgi:hypothetical protein
VPKAAGAARVAALGVGWGGVPMQGRGGIEDGLTGGGAWSPARWETTVAERTRRQLGREQNDVVVSVRHRRGWHSSGSSQGKGVRCGDEDELGLDTRGAVTDELAMPKAELDNGLGLDSGCTPRGRR